MKQIGICGNFGDYKDIANGQMVKTKELTKALKEYFGDSNVITVDTYEWRKKPFKLLINCFRLAQSCKNIIILPAQNGIKIFAPIFRLMCKIFNRKLHYSVIGGWLPEFLMENKNVYKNVKMMDSIYVETQNMKDRLEYMGLSNVVYMPNFKNIKPIDVSEISMNCNLPYRLCTFSRVKKEKGIIDAINAVKEINEELGEIAFTLDIYGTVEDIFECEFKKAIIENEDSCRYKGVIEFNKSTNILKDYFALIFPTYYEGEGFPGTIIDAFSSALPVIATDWKYNSEIILNNVTGLIYEVDINDERKQRYLVELLKNIYFNPEKITSMKKQCLIESEKYNVSKVIKYMTERMES